MNVERIGDQLRRNRQRQRRARHARRTMVQPGHRVKGVRRMTQPVRDRLLRLFERRVRVPH